MLLEKQGYMAVIYCHYLCIPGGVYFKKRDTLYLMKESTPWKKKGNTIKDSL